MGRQNATTYEELDKMKAPSVGKKCDRKEMAKTKLYQQLQIIMVRTVPLLMKMACTKDMQ